MRLPFYILAIIVLAGCVQADERPRQMFIDTTLPEKAVADKTDVGVKDSIPVMNAKNTIETGVVRREELVAFAKTQLGVPYLYASTDPAKGFDCSGFITYVFNHFNIAVPRSSVDFTHQGRDVDTSLALPGDLILFTGTDSTDRTVGHMGIVVENNEGKLSFIHSTSGKAYSVVITEFGKYYRSRFVKVIRVFP